MTTFVDEKSYEFFHKEGLFHENFTEEFLVILIAIYGSIAEIKPTCTTYIYIRTSNIIWARYNNFCLQNSVSREDDVPPSRPFGGERHAEGRLLRQGSFSSKRA